MDGEDSLTLLDEELVEALRDETARAVLREVIRLPERDRRIVLGIVQQFGERAAQAVKIGEVMTSYAGMARECKKARTLYLELRALGLELYAKEDPHEATGYRVRVAGLHSLSETHAERIRRRVEESKPDLLRVLFGRWDPDVVAIQREGATR